MSLCLGFVAKETLSRVASIECYPAQDGLGLLLSKPSLRVAGTEPHHAQLPNSIMPKMVFNCYYPNPLRVVVLYTIMPRMVLNVTIETL